MKTRLILQMLKGEQKKRDCSRFIFRISRKKDYKQSNTSKHSHRRYGKPENGFLKVFTLL